MRRFLPPLGLVLCAAALCSAAPEDDPARRGSDGGAGHVDLVTARQERAIERGLTWLADNQQPGGFWGEEAETRVADTALAVLALMAGGNTVGPGKRLLDADGNVRHEGPPQLRGPHAKSVRDGLRYLARLAWEERPGRTPGYIHDDKHSQMHGHGFATLALAQACGNLGGADADAIRAWLDAEPDRDPSQLSLAEQVRWGLERAVRLTLNAQDADSGGWYYTPTPVDHEGSMTVTQISALRAAQDAGVEVSGTQLRAAYDYIRESQNLANQTHYGGFAYQKSRMGRVSYALTAAALTTFFRLGRYGDNEEDKLLIERGMKYMDRTFEDDGLGNTQWFYYGMYYGAQAVYQESDAERIDEHWPRIRNTVLDLQQRDGSFRVVGNVGRTVPYSTAMGALILQIPLETLPIFQRR